MLRPLMNPPWLSSATEHTQHPARIYFADRYPGDRWLFSNPDVAKNPPDWRAKGHRHFELYRGNGSGSPNYPRDHLWSPVWHFGHTGLGAAISDSVPVIFNGTSVAIAVITLLMIGPIGGLVSVRLAVRVEPLIALGLSN